MVCKEVHMAPITWGPRTCAPLPVVPTAAGGFEDLRKVKEKLALTLKNNGMGWGEGTGGGGARGSLDCWRGQGERCSGAWGSVPDGLPVAGQDRLHRRTACAGAQGPMIKRASNLANALLLLF